MNPAWISAAAAVVAAICAIVAVARAGSWRKSEELLALRSRVHELSNRLMAIEGAQKHLATKEDLAVVTGKVENATQIARSTEKGVERIEAHLMRERSAG